MKGTVQVTLCLLCNNYACCNCVNPFNINVTVDLEEFKAYAFKSDKSSPLLEKILFRREREKLVNERFSVRED